MTANDASGQQGPDRGYGGAAGDPVDPAVFGGPGQSYQGSAGPGPAKGSRSVSTSKPGGGWRFLREVLVVFIGALILSVLVRTFLIQAFYVPSQSMENTLMPNDRIIASKITTTISGVGRGEVVVFKDPGGWLPPTAVSTSAVNSVLEFIGLLPSSSGDDLVKRVIGVAGDRVKCCNQAGQIVLNGVGLDEPYVKAGPGTDQVQFDIVVPPSSVFVMGDNRSQSADSRFHMNSNQGAVPLGDIVGRAVLKVWPLGSFGTIPIPATFDNPALNTTPKASGPTFANTPAGDDARVN
ncbi:MAG: signal peptidase I [Actinomycetes bacterium]